jgi:hypothetical protein
VSKKKNGDCDVGYGKPPKNSQFKPGQSGNPKGRPKGIKNLNTDLEEELNEKLVLTEAGKTIETTKQRAMLKSLFAKALKGDTRASNILLNLIIGLEQTRIAHDATDSLGVEDLAILEAYRDQVLAEVPNFNLEGGAT